MTTVAACRLYLHLAFLVLSVDQCTTTAFAMEGNLAQVTEAQVPKGNI